MIPLSLEGKLIAGAVLLLGLAGGGLWLQHRERSIGAAACEAEHAQAEAKRADAQAAAAQEAQRFEHQRAERVQEIQDAKDAELRRVGVELANALERLRNRPERLPEASRAACAGATGAELARPDAGFLARYAAFARGLQLALDACQQREQVNGKP